MSQTSLPSSAIKPQTAARFTYVEPDKVLQRLTCPVCLEPFVEPRRTPCKHTFCQGCITFIAAQPLAACPTCRAPLSNAKLETVDETLLEFLGELVVYCTNKCEWKGPRANLKEHLERTCERIACQHVARGCDFMGKAPVVQKHELECKYGDAPCALKCSYVGQRRFHSEHQGNCPVYLKQQEEARKKAEEEARKRREQVEAEEKRDRELQLYDSLNPAAENIVRLCVGGQHFQTSREVLCREPQSVLAGLFSGKRPLQRDNAGVVFLDLDPIAFGHILAWLRTGVVPGEHSPLLLETAKRLKLEGLIAVLGVPIEEPKKNPPLTQAELLHHVTSYALMGAVKKNSNSDPIQLPGANLSGLCLCGLNLSNANLTNANLSNANLSNANLWEANLSNTNLSNTDLTKANLAKADLTKANLTDAKIYNSCLTDANLTDTKISNSKLNNANLNNAKLTNANLTNANLTNAKIYNSSLSNAKLNNANLSNAKLNGAYLNNTDLTNANLTDADLTNADLSNANINGANLDKARGYRR